MNTDRRGFLGALLAAPILSRFVPGLAAYRGSRELSRAAYAGAFEQALRRYQACYAVQRTAWAPQLEAMRNATKIEIARIAASTRAAGISPS